MNYATTTPGCKLASGWPWLVIMSSVRDYICLHNYLRFEVACRWPSLEKIKKNKFKNLGSNVVYLNLVVCMPMVVLACFQSCHGYVPTSSLCSVAHIQVRVNLAPYPGPLSWRGERAWYTLCAHMHLGTPEQTWGIWRSSYIRPFTVHILTVYTYTMCTRPFLLLNSKGQSAMLVLTPPPPTSPPPKHPIHCWWVDKVTYSSTY